MRPLHEWQGVPIGTVMDGWQLESAQYENGRICEATAKFIGEKMLCTEQWFRKFAKEPSKHAWVTKCGHQARLRRNDFGAYCGYVGVCETSPLFEGARRAPDWRVHGGVTYTGRGNDAEGLDSQLWWFGFDCSHAGDLSPGLHIAPGDEYRDFEYVVAQCELLSEQVLAGESAADGELKAAMERPFVVTRVATAAGIADALRQQREEIAAWLESEAVDSSMWPETATALAWAARRIRSGEASK